MEEGMCLKSFEMYCKTGKKEKESADNRQEGIREGRREGERGKKEERRRKEGRKDGQEKERRR